MDANQDGGHADSDAAMEFGGLAPAPLSSEKKQMQGSLSQFAYFGKEAPMSSSPGNQNNNNQDGGIDMMDIDLKQPDQ